MTRPRKASARRCAASTSRGPVPADLAFIKRERFTPVFVLIDQGREFGRIRGYPGDIFFWGLLANLIERLDRGEPAPANPWAATRRRARPSADMISVL